MVCGKMRLCWTTFVNSLQGSFPVVVAASLWGHRRITKREEFCSDNMVVVSILHSGSSKYPNMMVILHYLHVSLTAAHNSFAFTPSCTHKQDNAISEALSHFDFQHYFLSSSSTCSSHCYTNTTITVGPTSCDLTGSANSTWLMALPLQLVKSMAQLNASL